ncbi:dystrophin-like isoform X2 [Paramacrobiotus metropolitanus]|uniref:dystrophin-like isoform X2 n=1 Tax=Paramacrobiotus metropolitanus TaxID=2943436 RepID=UPI002445A9FC|nr:dystrophin-like isoform X2 [Paramacrobiotus metropolitanus]
MSVREGKRRLRAREERRKTNPGLTEMADDVVKDIIKGRTDEQERVQQKVFAEWINSRFSKGGSPVRINDLFHDLRTGITLAALTEILTGIKVPVEKGRTRLHHVCNIAKALEILEQNEIKISNLNVSADDIADGNTKLTLSLTWAVIQQFYVKRLSGAVADLRISNLEKTLLCWCQLATKGYQHVDVRNLSTSWSDGLAFNALIHKYRDHLFDYSALLNNTAEANLAHAFGIAKEHLGVSPLLDPEDLIQGTPDQKSIVTYLLCLLEVLPQETMEAKVVAAISELDSNMSNGDKPAWDASAYQLSIENMLTWMLSVEEKLDRCELADNLPEIRKLWDEHEVLLSELVMQEHSLRHILDHSARLLQNPKLPAKRVADVENDISVLTEKWENVQIKSSERTKLLQKMITILQEEHLKNVDIWLSDAEKRMESLKSNANSIESMDAQLRELSKLQDDLEKQLPAMNELLTVVVIGLNSDDNGAQSQLDDFRQRWETICRWSESQWSIVRRIRTYYEDFFKLCNECGEWITNRIELLQGLPSVAGDRLDWVQRNVDLLREMHDQMLDYQERIQTLQERSDELVTYFTPQSSTGMQVRRREEKICSEWNHLVDLLEFWTSDKNMHFDKSDVLRTSKIRHSKRFSDTVDSSFSPPASDDNEQPRTKKAKQEEMDEGLMENCNALVEWLNEKESTLSSVQASAGSSPDIALINQIKDEMHNREAEYKSLKMLGEDIITEKHAAGASCQSIEDKLNQLAALWMKLNWIIENKSSTALSIDQDLEILHNNMAVLKDVLISCQKTVERIGGGKDVPVQVMNQNVDDCKDRLHLMEINQPRFRQTALLAKRLAMDDISDKKITTSAWDDFNEQWHKTNDELNGLVRELSVMKENQPVKEVLNDLKNLQMWTSEIHQMLMDEPPVRMTFLDKMEGSLRHYNEVEQSLAERQEVLERINAPPKQLAEKLVGTNFQLDLVDLNSKWKDIRQYLQYNMNELMKWVEELRAFQIDMDGLKQWMVDVDTFLNIDIESVEDNKTFMQVQEQFQGLEEDINVLRPTVDKLMDTGRSFLRNNQKEFVECIEKCLKEMESQWTSVHTRAARQLQTVAAVSAARKKNMTELQRDMQELEEIRHRVPDDSNIMTLEAFEKAIESVQEIKAILESKLNDVRDKNGAGSPNNSQDDDALHRYDLNLQDCLETTKNREAHFASISEKWRTFSEMLTEHHSWMDKLESLIVKLETCDDEKLRREQQMALLEFMKTQNGESYATVAEIAEEFDHRRILSPLVKADLEKLRQRLSKLLKRAQEQQSVLVDSQSRYSLFSDTGSESGAVQSPFSEGLERVSHLLNELRDKLPATELKVFDSGVIAEQLHDCVQMYEKLKQIKGEVEALIRQGHAIVEADPTLPESESLSQRLDSIKTQYNQLGAQVTATKAELDNVVRLVTKAEKELDTWRISMDEIDQALAELAELAGVEEFDDTLADIKSSVAHQEETLSSLRNMRQRMREIAMKPTIPGFDPKYSQHSQRWLAIQNRVKTAKLQQVVPHKISTPSVEVPSREGQTERVIVKEEVIKTVVTSTTAVASERPNLYRQPTNKSSPPPLNLGITHLKEYQRSLQQKINAAHERVVLTNVEGKKATGRHAEELNTEIANLQQRLENSRQAENAMRKFDTFCVSCEEKLLTLLRMPPASAAEVKVRASDLEAVKHEVMVNQAVYKDVVSCVDAAVTNSRDANDTNQLELVKVAINNRWTDIQEKLKSSGKDLSSVLLLYESLENELRPWLEKTETLAANDKFSDTERQTMLIDEKANKLATYNMILDLGNNVLNNVYKSPNAEPLRGQLDDVKHRWNRLGGRMKDISASPRNGLEESFDEAAIMALLTEHWNWVKRKQEELSTLQPSGDRILLQRLHDFHQLFRAQLEAKRPEIEAALSKGRALEQRLQSPTSKPLSAQSTTVSMEQLNRKMEELSASWRTIFLQSDALQQETEVLTGELDNLLKLCETVRPKLDDLERESNKWESTDEVNLEDLNKRLEEAKKFKVKIDAQNPKLEEITSLAARIQRTPGSLSEEVVRSVEKLNKHQHSLSVKIEERLSQLEGALEDVSSSSNQHILGSSVDDPWERRVSPSKVPYFINHAEQSTTWDHPKLIDLMSAVNDVNKIRFSAYRTAAKLRIVQRKLYLDLLPLKEAAEIFDKCGLRAQNAATLDCSAAVDCLMMVYERLNEENPNRINFALAIDVCLNWLLNCHDPKRTGQIPVLAFKLSLIILCQGELIDKYKYLFRLIADENQNADRQHISQLLRHFLDIPLYLAEVAAFGGSNVEPSVQSCFEFSTNGIDIQAKQFLSWLAREPQSLVWLSVLHRLIAAEGARHPAKCNICRQFPIVGLRYRCLKCFNFDLCQNCFFTGQKSKHHKISHPMQEYCFPASSSEDMRDFRRVLKNKLRSKDASTGMDTKQLGYLPVQPVTSGKAPADTTTATSTLNSHNTKGSVSSGDGVSAFTQSRVIEMDEARYTSTPEIDDEHDLIARYSSILNGTPSAQTTGQVLQTVEREEKQEMEEYLRQLQMDHDKLIQELEHTRYLHESMPNDDLVAEASILREDKSRLEARMKILEDHNRQLDAQLKRIKNLVDETHERNAATLPANGSVGRRYDSPHDDLALSHRISSRSPSSAHNSPAFSRVTATQNSYSVGQLFHAAGSLNVAVGTLVTVMNEEERRLDSQNSNVNPS